MITLHVWGDFWYAYSQHEDVTQHLRRGKAAWRRTTNVIGGYDIGRLSIRGVNQHVLTRYFHTWLGLHMQEYTYGITSYDGLIWQMDLVINGVNYRRTLQNGNWHNRVKVKYMDANDEAQETAWAEDTTSTEQYGDMEYIISIGDATSSQATSIRDKELNEFAFPSSRVVGATDVNSYSQQGDGLYVTTVGYYSTMNWRIREAALSDTADDAIEIFTNASEFITPGYVETNTMTIEVKDSPQRLWDLVVDVVNQGDTSGNRYACGVYNDQVLTYEQISPDVNHTLYKGKLLRAGTSPAPPSLIRPGFYVRDTGSAFTYTHPSGLPNDASQVGFVEAVEYIYPNQLQLKFPGEKFVPIANFPDFPAPNAPIPGGGPGDTPTWQPPEPTPTWPDSPGTLPIDGIPVPDPSGSDNISSNDPVKPPPPEDDNIGKLPPPPVIGEPDTGEIDTGVIGDGDTGRRTLL